MLLSDWPVCKQACVTFPRLMTAVGGPSPMSGEWPHPRTGGPRLYQSCEKHCSSMNSVRQVVLDCIRAAWSGCEKHRSSMVSVSASASRFLLESCPGFLQWRTLTLMFQINSSASCQEKANWNSGWAGSERELWLKTGFVAPEKCPYSRNRKLRIHSKPINSWLQLSLAKINAKLNKTLTFPKYLYTQRLVWPSLCRRPSRPRVSLWRTGCASPPTGFLSLSSQSFLKRLGKRTEQNIDLVGSVWLLYPMHRSYSVVFWFDSDLKITQSWFWRPTPRWHDGLEV